MTIPNPTLRQRQLAMRLRELRNEKGLSIAEVAQLLLCSPAKISRIETAQRGVSLRDVRDLCRLYEVTPAESAQLMTLAKDARQKEWWQFYDNPELRPMLGLEAEAVAITEYEITTVPGLLQTEDYARAVISGWLPRIAPDVLEDRVKVRMKRQAWLQRADTLRYWVLLDESVLCRHVGSRQTMREQLKRLIELSELPHVTIQVIPFTAGAHAGFDSTFRLMEFTQDAGIADTIFVEHQMGLFYLETDKAVRRFREIIDHLRAEALGIQESKRRITDMAAEFI
ncbi:MAG: helix-turn-helix domain-containing protein [Nonomuraea sp.]|nr:helix-turn-helix domain-containing protein [Nonomuraea sp.]NUP69012.1 helix-turn-helix domain-containing protein [Nonomuraea sp.]NUP81561.1 helix-turn-helix domain-containing protein [Nonomuraea sp.]NUS02198.1 helix-turn-helix domain-containing protein [Nonomuraea sp.]